MKYNRPEDISVFFMGGFDLPEDAKRIITANFRDVAFCIFTLLDSDSNKIGPYKVTVEDQANMILSTIKLYYMTKCVFELNECNSGQWMATAYCDPELLQTFSFMIDNQFHIW